MGALAATSATAAGIAHRDYFAELGVKPFINAAGVTKFEYLGDVIKLVETDDYRNASVLFMK